VHVGGNGEDFSISLHRLNTNYHKMSSVIVTTLHCVSTRYAAGLHAWDVTNQWAITSNKFTYASLIFYAPTASLAKISLCMTYLRILPTPSDRLFAKTGIVYSIGYCISVTFVMVFQCRLASPPKSFSQMILTEMTAPYHNTGRRA
jgi:hypothetical protein